MVAVVLAGYLEEHKYFILTACRCLRKYQVCLSKSFLNYNVFFYIPLDIRTVATWGHCNLLPVTSG